MGVEVTGMRVLYIMPRYHTNQRSIMKGWIEHGDDVSVITQFSDGIEDHEYVTPVVAGYSRLFSAFYFLWVRVIKRKDSYAKDIRIKIGWPSMHRMRRLIQEAGADLVICRERSWYTMACYAICKRLHVPAFLYNQSPLWAEPSYWRDDLLHRLVRQHCPEYRYTPVRQRGMSMTGKVMESDRSYFAPFVVEVSCSPEERSYYQDGMIHLFAVGKYQERKNHMMLVRVVERLLRQYPAIHLDIAGECSNHFHEEYYERLRAYLVEHHLDSVVTLHRNLTRMQVEEFYRQADLFILASTQEPAAVSAIEAMACSVPAISSTDNGTADYIIPGETGAIFRDCDEEDLYCRMNEILQERDNIPRMGAAAYRHVRDYYQFENYYDVIMQMLSDQRAERNGRA